MKNANQRINEAVDFDKTWIAANAVIESFGFPLICNETFWGIWLVDNFKDLGELCHDVTISGENA